MVRQRAATWVRRCAAAAGRRALAAFNRADEIGGEVRDWLLARTNSPALRAVSERLVRVRGGEDAALAVDSQRSAREAAIARQTAEAPPPTAAELAARRSDALGDPEVAAQVYGRASCPWTGRAQSLLNDAKVDYDFVDLDDPDHAHLEGRLVGQTRQNTTPWVFLRGEFVGGYHELDEIARLGQLDARTLPRDRRPPADPARPNVEVAPRPA